MSTTVAAVRVHPDKYEKDFSKVVTFLSQYISQRAPTPSVKVASVGQSRPAKWQKTSATCSPFKGKIELKKYSREEYTQYQWHSINSYMSSGRKPELLKVRRPQEAAEL